MKIESLTPGQVVYYVYTERFGNTTMRSTSVQSITVVSVDVGKRTVVGRSNGRERTYYDASIKKWRVKKPLLIRGLMGKSRLATRAEIKEHAARVACTDAD